MGLEKSILPRHPLEDPHEQPGGFHGGLLVQPLELESDAGDVVLGLLRVVALEGQLSGEQHVEEDAQAPNVGLGEGLGLFNDLGS